MSRPSWMAALQDVVKKAKKHGRDPALGDLDALLRQQPGLEDRLSIVSAWSSKTNEPPEGRRQLMRVAMADLPRATVVRSLLDLARTKSPQAAAALQAALTLAEPEDNAAMTGALLELLRDPRGDVSGQALYAIRQRADAKPDDLTPTVQKLLTSKSAREQEAGYHLISSNAGRSLLPQALSQLARDARNADTRTHEKAVALIEAMARNLDQPAAHEAAIILDVLKELYRDRAAPREARCGAHRRAADVLGHFERHGLPVRELSDHFEKIAFEPEQDIRDHLPTNFEAFTWLFLRLDMPEDAVRSVRLANDIRGDQLSQTPHLESTTRAYLLNLELYGNALYANGELDEALHKFREALDLAQEIRQTAATHAETPRHADYAAEGRLLVRIGDVLNDLGRPTDALRHHDEAIRLIEPVWDPDQPRMIMHAMLAGVLREANLGAAEAYEALHDRPAAAARVQRARACHDLAQAEPVRPEVLQRLDRALQNHPVED